MQNQAKATLRKMLVQSLTVSIDADKIVEKKESLKLGALGKSELRIPKKEGDTTFLLVSDVEIKSENEPNIFKGKISAEFYFELNELVQDYDSIVREQALPMIQEETISFANKVLSGMGYGEFLQMQK